MLYIVDQDCDGACHLKKLFFCYHLPTRGRARVKLGDAWYVSNVSIIFDAPCLLIHHLLCVLLHFVAFYAFSGNNLLTRYHSASSLFSVVFVFQKSYTGNILGFGRNKSQTCYFPEASWSPKMRWRGASGQAHPRVERLPLARTTRGWDQLVHLLMPPFRLYIPFDRKNLRTDRFSSKILQATAVIIARSGGSRSSSQHPAGEGNPCRRPSPPPWSPPEWCVSSLRWTMGP
jgi:hypothetical protein